MQSKNKFLDCRPTKLSWALIACRTGGTVLALACALSLASTSAFADDEYDRSSMKMATQHILMET